MEKYNVIGKTYNLTRMADERITNKIIELLNLKVNSTIADIGAGTGNYTYELAKSGYKLTAIEPSEVMKAQGKIHPNILWKDGYAEKIPIQNNEMDGVICILATHHFSSLDDSFKEMKRVLKDKGTLLIFTFDPRLCPKNFWISEYFNEIILNSYAIHPPIEELCSKIEKQTGKKSFQISFPLPYDLKDGFFMSAWRYPERYLNRRFCEGISVLAQLKDSERDILLKRLEKDLKNGEWENKHGSIRQLIEYECGYRFILVKEQVKI